MLAKSVSVAVALFGENVLRVEDVQALVLHRAHVEVAGGDDHEALQVQRQAEAGLVPDHAGDQRVHGVFGLVHVAGAHIDLQQMVLAAAAADALFARHQLAGHQRKQVAGLLVRIDPLREVATVGQVAFFDQVAVGQQHRVLGLVGAQRDGVACHHVRTVQEIGDAAKTLGFTLREEGVLAHVQTHELGVFLRRAGGEDLQLEGFGAIGQVAQHQGLALHLERAAAAVEQHARQVQVFAIQSQRLRRHVGVAAQHHLVEHARLERVQVKAQVDGVDPERGRCVVFATDHHRRAIGPHAVVA